LSYKIARGSGEGRLVSEGLSLRARGIAVDYMQAVSGVRGNGAITMQEIEHCFICTSILEKLPYLGNFLEALLSKRDES